MAVTRKRPPGVVADALAIVTGVDAVYAERTGGFAAIGSIDDTQASLRGDAGTRVALDAAAVGR